MGYVIAKYAALANVEDVSPQDLRHRFGYVMAERVPLHSLAQIMGHDDSLDTTIVYVRVTRGDLQRAVEERAWGKMTLTGFTDLDRLTGGFAEGALAVLASRPYVGKTPLVLSLRFNPVGSKGCGRLSVSA